MCWFLGPCRSWVLPLDPPDPETVRRCEYNLRGLQEARDQGGPGNQTLPKTFCNHKGRLPLAITEREVWKFEILYKSGLFTIFISLWFFILINQLSCFYFSGCGIPTFASGCSHSRGRLVLVAARLLHHSVLCLSLAGWCTPTKVETQRNVVWEAKIWKIWTMQLPFFSGWHTITYIFFFLPFSFFFFYWINSKVV